MTEENKAKLLQAYRAAVAAGQDGIADMLEDVILGEMETERPAVTFRDSAAGAFDSMPMVSLTHGSGRAITCERCKGVEL